MVVILGHKEHINLLLACYTKIKDDSKISSALSVFLRSAPPPAHLTAKSKADNQGSVDNKLFDAKQAIITFSNAGYIGNKNTVDE